MRDPMKKKKQKHEICFTASSVQILEISIQCVVVDVHIDQALQKIEKAIQSQVYKNFCPKVLIQIF